MSSEKDVWRIVICENCKIYGVERFPPREKLEDLQPMKAMCMKCMKSALKEVTRTFEKKDLDKKISELEKDGLYNGLAGY